MYKQLYEHNTVYLHARMAGVVMHWTVLLIYRYNYGLQNVVYVIFYNLLSYLSKCSTV